MVAIASQAQKLTAKIAILDNYGCYAASELMNHLKGCWSTNKCTRMKE